MEGRELGLNMESIAPPSLDDAGLELCDLPPQSIMEAFLKAANSLKSRLVLSDDDDDEDERSGGCCLDNPSPNNRNLPDSLTGGDAPPCDHIPCGGSRTKGVVGGGCGGDKVVVIGGVGGGDRVLGGRPIEEKERKKCCVVIGGDTCDCVGYKEEDDDDLEEEEKPVLVEDFI